MDNKCVSVVELV